MMVDLNDMSKSVAGEDSSSKLTRAYIPAECVICSVISMSQRTNSDALTQSFFFL